VQLGSICVSHPRHPFHSVVAGPSAILFVPLGVGCFLAGSSPTIHSTLWWWALRPFISVPLGVGCFVLFFVSSLTACCAAQGGASLYYPPYPPSSLHGVCG
jgi:hypothetical protein